MFVLIGLKLYFWMLPALCFGIWSTFILLSNCSVWSLKRKWGNPPIVNSLQIKLVTHLKSTQYGSWKVLVKSRISNELKYENDIWSRPLLNMSLELPTGLPTMNLGIIDHFWSLPTTWVRAELFTLVMIEK